MDETDFLGFKSWYGSKETITYSDYVSENEIVGIWRFDTKTNIYYHGHPHTTFQKMRQNRCSCGAEIPSVIILAFKLGVKS